MFTHFLKRTQNIDCTIGDTQITCDNVNNVESFKNSRLRYYVADHSEDESIEIRLEHIIDKCYNSKYEMPKRTLSSKNTEKYKKEEDGFKNRSNMINSMRKSKKTSDITCLLNMNIQAPHEGQLIVGVSVLENKRIIFDKTNNMIGIGPAKPTFSLLRIAKSGFKSFMKIFSKLSKKDRAAYSEQEQP